MRPLARLLVFVRRGLGSIAAVARQRQARIGLAVGYSRVRAVYVRGTRVVWAFEGELEPGEPLADALRDAFRAAPRVRRFRPRVIVCLGPSRAQVKRVLGLPDLDDPRARHLLLQENIERLFLRNGVPLLAAECWRDASGALWAAAFQQSDVDAIRSACKATRSSLEAVVPSVAVLGAGVRDGRLDWRDGDVTATVTLQDGILAGITRRPTNHAPQDAAGMGRDETTDRAMLATPVPALDMIGPAAAKYADAYGAVAYPGRLPLAWRARLASTSSATPTWRAYIAGAVLVASIIGALVGPGIRDTVRAQRANRQLELATDARGEAARLEAELHQVTGALSEVDRFAERGVNSLHFLAQLTAEYPLESAVSALRMDSAGVTIVVLGESALAILSATERMAATAHAHVVGPITRERHGGRDLERATIRLRLARPSSAAASPAMRDSLRVAQGSR